MLFTTAGTYSRGRWMPGCLSIGYYHYFLLLSLYFSKYLLLYLRFSTICYYLGIDRYVFLVSNIVCGVQFERQDAG